MLMLEKLPLEAGAYYILDRGYLSLLRLHHINAAFAFFVTRAKRGLHFTRVYSHPVDQSTGVRVDQSIRFNVWRSRKEYPSLLRRIKFHDNERDKDLVFLTNNFRLPARTIADLYRSRWQVELFFKWIKQHLRVKAFYGTSRNAILTQIWIAVSVYVLVAIVKRQLHLDDSFYTILQILSVSLFQKEPILQAFQRPDYKNVPPPPSNQLLLFNF
jgi:IS4 transposase